MKSFFLSIVDFLGIPVALFLCMFLINTYFMPQGISYMALSYGTAHAAAQLHEQLACDGGGEWRVTGFPKAFPGNSFDVSNPPYEGMDYTVTYALKEVPRVTASVEHGSIDSAILVTNARGEDRIVYLSSSVPTALAASETYTLPEAVSDTAAITTMGLPLLTSDFSKDEAANMSLCLFKNADALWGSVQAPTSTAIQWISRIDESVEGVPGWDGKGESVLYTCSDGSHINAGNTELLYVKRGDAYVAIDASDGSHSLGGEVIGNVTPQGEVVSWAGASSTDILHDPRNIASCVNSRHETLQHVLENQHANYFVYDPSMK